MPTSAPRAAPPYPAIAKPADTKHCKQAVAGEPAELVALIADSQLAGRGGAGFPTGQKWQAVAEAPGTPKTVVCNADEGEPGCFKDRALLEWDPHAVIEGMLLAAYATGATRAFIYLRYEYPEINAILANAIAEARTANLIGPRILGSDFSCELDIRRGAGAYICGEEGSLLNSLEGKHPYPRNRPPFPVTHGFEDLPTAVNNVETLASVPQIVRRGAAWYRALGLDGHPGTKVISLSGDVQRPGNYEVPFGLPLDTLLHEWAGGPGPNRQIQAVTMAGISGGFLAGDDLDVTLDEPAIRARGSMLGAGGIMAFDDRRDIVEIARQAMAFFCRGILRQVLPLSHRHPAADRAALWRWTNGPSGLARRSNRHRRHHEGHQRLRPRHGRSLYHRQPPQVLSRPSSSAHLRLNEGLTMNTNGKPHTLTLDGEEVSFAPGETLYEVAQRHRRDIPTLCYDPRLESFGACRLCVVEIEGSRNPVASCTAQAAPGMVVKTSTATIEKHRKTLLEMVVSENREVEVDPLRGYASQELTDLADRYQARSGRFQGAQSGQVHPTDDNPFILRDYGLVHLVQSLRPRLRRAGRRTTPLPRWGAASTSRSPPSSMACSRIRPAPSAANASRPAPPAPSPTKRPLRAADLPGEIEKTRSVCPYCGVGCSVDLLSKEDKLVGIQPAMDGPGQRGRAVHQGPVCL